MSVSDLYRLLPLLILAAGVVLTLLSIAVYRHHRVVLLISLISLIVAFISVPFIFLDQTQTVTLLLMIDRFGLLLMGLIIFAGIIILLLSYQYWSMQDVLREEFYVLLLLAVLGSSVLVVSIHFAPAFLGLEILSVSLYGLIAYRRDNQLGIEAGLKYLILAGASSAFLLFGMALIYADLGTMHLGEITSVLAGSAQVHALTLTGMAMVLVGIGYKLALFPFHLWTPDVYEGAPLLVAALIATISKGAVLGLLIRLTIMLPGVGSTHLRLTLLLLSILSMFAGNLLALRQKNLKRILAYSSIAQMGYLLIAVLAGGIAGTSAAVFYLAAYIITILAAFSVMSAVSAASRDADLLQHYQGLAWRRPVLAAVLTAALLSLAGMPLTAGFIGKILLVSAGIGAGLWGAALILVINSGMSIYYYVRVVRVMYRAADQLEGPAILAAPRLSLFTGCAVSLLTVLLVGIGMYPAPLLRIVQLLRP